MRPQRLGQNGAGDDKEQLGESAGDARAQPLNDVGAPMWNRHGSPPHLRVVQQFLWFDRPYVGRRAVDKDDIGIWYSAADRDRMGWRSWLCRGGGRRHYTNPQRKLLDERQTAPQFGRAT